MVKFTDAGRCGQNDGNHVFNEIEAGWEDGPDGDAVHGVPGRVADDAKRGGDAFPVPEAWRTRDFDARGVC
jgi:hypothetical protein